MLVAERAGHEPWLSAAGWADGEEEITGKKWGEDYRERWQTANKTDLLRNYRFCGEIGRDEEG
jgi:hypothetical protein